MKKFKFIPATLIAVAILSACNSTTHNAALSDAHFSYDSARVNPNVASLAAPELKEAGDSLAKADQALNNGESPVEINHLAYLATQQVLVAQETAKRKSAEAVVANAKADRTQIRLEARTAEADAAKQQVAVVQANAKKQAAEMQATTDQQAEELAAASANAASDQALISRQAKELKELNAKKTERGLVITLGDVLFSSSKAQLKAGGMHNVQKLADFLRENPKHKVLIEGYTDNTGSEQLNQRLSERRANNVQSALVGVMGIDSNRVSTRGYGKEFPVANNDTATGRQLNRRVEIIISDENGKISSR